MHPMDHMSADFQLRGGADFGSKVEAKTSGAKYFIWEGTNSGNGKLGKGNNDRAAEKLQNLRVQSSDIRMLVGFMSRWTSSCLCK